MTISYLITKLPILYFKEKPKINKKQFIKMLIENQDSLKKEELDLILLNEEINLLEKNNSFFYSIIKNKKTQIKNFIDYDYEVLKITHFDIKIFEDNRKEIKKNLSNFFIKKTNSGFLKDINFFYQNLKNILLFINLELNNSEEKKIIKELKYIENNLDIINKIKNKAFLKDNKQYKEINNIIKDIKTSNEYEKLELIIEEIKWKEIEKKINFYDFFSMEFIHQYYQKILILERINSFNIESGKKIFQELFIL